MWPFKDKSKWMFGKVDLEKWTYLGSVALNHSSVFMFAEKGNEEKGKRHFIHVGDFAGMDTSERIFVEIEVWKHHEHPLYAVVHEPSDFLRRHMKRTRNCGWNPDMGRWTPLAEARPLTTDHDKYMGAFFQQKMGGDASAKKEKSQKKKEESNVIPFPKKKKEPVDEN